MSNGSLGFSFIESTEKIKGKLKMSKPKNPVQIVPLSMHNEQPTNNNYNGVDEDDGDDSGLANVDFSPPPPPLSSGFQKTIDADDNDMPNMSNI